MQDQDQIIEEFLEGNPRADTWKELREALGARLADAVSARDEMTQDDPCRAALEKRIGELRTQVAALAQEEAVTQFVEDSVRASLVRPRLDLGDEDEEGG